MINNNNNINLHLLISLLVSGCLLWNVRMRLHTTILRWSCATRFCRTRAVSTSALLCEFCALCVCPPAMKAFSRIWRYSAGVCSRSALGSLGSVSVYPGWNCVSPDIRTIDSHHSFQRSLKAHSFCKAFNITPPKLLLFILMLIHHFIIFYFTCWCCKAWSFCKHLH